MKDILTKRIRLTTADGEKYEGELIKLEDGVGVIQLDDGTQRPFTLKGRGE